MDVVSVIEMGMALQQASKWGGVVGFLHVHGLGGARVALEEVVGSGWLWALVEVFAADPALLWSSGHGGL